jgi:hypothetical protein
VRANETVNNRNFTKEKHMNIKCPCGSDQHSLAQSAACDGKRHYGAKYEAPKKKVKK